MDIKINYLGDGVRDKYEIEHYGSMVEIKRIYDTTTYDGRDNINKTNETTAISIPIGDLNKLVLSLQKILY